MNIYCELCQRHPAAPVFGRRFCYICQVRLVEDGTYVNGMEVRYDEIPAGLYIEPPRVDSKERD